MFEQDPYDKWHVQLPFCSQRAIPKQTVCPQEKVHRDGFKFHECQSELKRFCAVEG
jgi:hypothetical protein